MNLIQNIDFPDLKDISSDLIDSKFQYGGSTVNYPSDPKSTWQKEIRKHRASNKISKKGEMRTFYDYMLIIRLLSEKNLLI